MYLHKCESVWCDDDDDDDDDDNIALEMLPSLLQLEFFRSSTISTSYYSSSYACLCQSVSLTLSRSPLHDDSPPNSNATSSSSTHTTSTIYD